MNLTEFPGLKGEFWGLTFPRLEGELWGHEK